jgi:predicted esterase
MSRRLGALILFPLLSIGLVAVTPDPEQLPAGQVTEKIVCRQDPSQSYALYLPPAYTPDRKWPLLLCFDPGARGSVPVKLFQAAAEKFGWIVAGSNNSRNGPWSDVEPAMAAMWEDTHSRFTVDARRVYTTGFSGGSRVAMETALRHPDEVAGVIVCSGGMPRERGLPVPVPFAVFVSAGRKDFNFLEVWRLDNILAREKAAHRMDVFDGAHEWPPSDIAGAAVGWFEILAMGQGRRDKDPALAAAVLAESRDRARDLTVNGRLPEAIRLLEGLVRDFDGLTDLAAVKADLKELKHAPALKQLQKAERKREKAELDYQITSNGIWKELQDLSRPVPKLDEVIAELKIEEILKTAREQRGTEDGYLAARQLNWVLMEAFMEAPQWRQREDVPRELFCLRLTAAILPDRPAARYNLAAGLAAAGQIGEAFAELKTAVEKGFQDADQLEKDPDFTALRGNTAFQALLAGLKEKK